MKKFKSRFIFLPLIIIALAIVGIYLGDNATFRAEYGKSDKIIQEKNALERLIKNSSEIQRIWWEGEESREWGLFKTQCLKKWGITKDFDESLLRCNPMLIECINEFDKNKKFQLTEVDGKNSIYKYLTLENTTHLKISNPGYFFKLKDGLSNQVLDILLEDNCHEVYLDQRIYAYGQMPKKTEGDDFHFDNFNMNLYLDRSLVTNFDINQWIMFGNTKLTAGLTMKVGNELFLPATHLLYSQMENYCAFKAKQIMMAHYFDAATFTPDDIDNKTPTNYDRSNFYWTKNKNVKNISCDLLYGKECLSQEEYRINKYSPSWAGLNDSMGGVLEAFYNPIEPELNLKISSFYLPLNSKFQRLGERVHWDGEGFGINHFNFFKADIDKNQQEYQVAFRCMRQVQ